MDMPSDMQFENMPPTAAEMRTAHVPTIRVEWVAYAMLLALALVLRLAELDSTPLFASETHNALAAWRLVMPNAPGTPLISSSPILFTLQSLSFVLFGDKELTARLATALGGAALILMPLLFRPLIGRARAFLISLLLALSPVLLLASRSSSPDVWALLLAGLSLWAYWRAGERGERYAVLAVVFFVALVFLVGASGLALAFILVVTALVTSWWRRRFSESDDTGEGVSLAAGSYAVVQRSLGTSVPLAALAVLTIATGFMLYPAGLSNVGEGIAAAVRALIQPRGTGGYAAQVALFYEPVLWLLAVVGLLLRRDRLTTLDVFLTVWVFMGVVVSLVFADGVPDHALWLTLPLAALSVSTLLSMLTPDDRIGFLPPPPSARWVVAVGMLGVLGVFTLSFQSVARSMVQAPQPALTMITPPPDSIVLVLVSVLFMIIGYFLFASLWGSRTSWQGIGLGLAIFGLITSLGAGWNAAVANAPNPVVFWHMQATNGDTALLRTTLYEVADRQTGGWPTLPVMIIAPQDGELAWVLRDFTKTRYINDLSDVQDAEVVLLPASIDKPQLGGAYLGQKFTISRTWDISGMNPVDLAGWWTQQATRSPWISADDYVLWLRQDIYEGLDQTKAAAG